MAPYKDVFRNQSNNQSTIYNEAFFAEILSGFKLLTIFAKKGPLQMFDWVENRLLVFR